MKRRIRGYRLHRVERRRASQSSNRFDTDAGALVAEPCGQVRNIGGVDPLPEAANRKQPDALVRIGRRLNQCSFGSLVAVPRKGVRGGKADVGIVVAHRPDECLRGGVGQLGRVLDLSAPQRSEAATKKRVGRLGANACISVRQEGSDHCRSVRAGQLAQRFQRGGDDFGFGVAQQGTHHVRCSRFDGLIGNEPELADCEERRQANSEIFVVQCRTERAEVARRLNTPHRPRGHGAFGRLSTRQLLEQHPGLGGTAIFRGADFRASDLGRIQRCRASDKQAETGHAFYERKASRMSTHAGLLDEWMG